ncbi:MAG: hypothetical protein FJZ96_12595 [Chloroflexi bacterium]|nr:hypothetical protein [Chloroflexota bacterium]
MNSISMYAIQLAVTLTMSLLLTAYIRPFLKRVLVDLCGAEERARFWVAFTNILLILTPTLFALGYQPGPAMSGEWFFAVTRQLRGALFMFISALLGTGMAVGFFALVAPRPQNGK